MCIIPSSTPQLQLFAITRCQGHREPQDITIASVLAMPPSLGLFTHDLKIQPTWIFQEEMPPKLLRSRVRALLLLLPGDCEGSKWIYRSSSHWSV